MAHRTVAALDRALSVSCENVTIRRVVGTASNQTFVDLDCVAVVRDYTANELVGGIQQGDRKLVMSPTEMSERQWPGPPRANDKAIVGGKILNVQNVDIIRIGDEIVRLELQIRG